MTRGGRGTAGGPAVRLVFAVVVLMCVGRAEGGDKASTSMVLASWNRGKLMELAEVARVMRVNLHAASDLGVKSRPFVEPGGALEENAKSKALWVTKQVCLPTMADSSHLSIPSLGGTSWYTQCSQGGAGEALLERLNDALVSAGAERKAQYECVMCFALPDGRYVTATDNLNGKIVWPPRHGSSGATSEVYSVFVPEGEARTLSEMGFDVMANQNHRHACFSALVKRMFLEGLCDCRMTYNGFKDPGELEQNTYVQEILEFVRPRGTNIVKNEYIMPYSQQGRDYIMYPSLPDEETLGTQLDPEGLRQDAIDMVTQAAEIRGRAADAESDAEVNQLHKDSTTMLSNALSLARKVSGCDDVQGVALSNLGTLYGDTVQALEAYREALQASIRCDDVQSIVVTLGKAAWTMSRLGMTQDAVDHYDMALQIAVKQEFEDLEGRLYHGLAAVYFDVGEKEEALRCSQRAVELAESSDDIGGVRAASSLLATIWASLGRPDLQARYRIKSTEATVEGLVERDDLEGAAAFHGNLQVMRADAERQGWVDGDGDGSVRRGSEQADARMIEAEEAHGDARGRYGGADQAHGDARGRYGGADQAHGDARGRYGGAEEAHGDARGRYGGAEQAHGDARGRYGGAEQAHGDARGRYGGAHVGDYDHDAGYGQTGYDGYGAPGVAGVRGEGRGGGTQMPRGRPR